MINLLLALTKKIDPNQRHNFLATFFAELPAKDKQTEVPTEVPKTNSTELLAEIEEFQDDIRIRTSSIHDGIYWAD